MDARKCVHLEMESNPDENTRHRFNKRRPLRCNLHRPNHVSIFVQKALRGVDLSKHNIRFLELFSDKLIERQGGIGLGQ